MDQSSEAKPVNLLISLFFLSLTGWVVRAPALPSPELRPSDLLLKHRGGGCWLGRLQMLPEPQAAPLSLPSPSRVLTSAGILNRTGSHGPQKPKWVATWSKPLIQSGGWLASRKDAEHFTTVISSFLKVAAYRRYDLDFTKIEVEIKWCVKGLPMSKMAFPASEAMLMWFETPFP